MGWGTFFDTFVEGGVEIGFSLATQNPLLLAGGVQNILAGIVASWNTVSVYVDPLDFFGAAGTSALIGFFLAHGLAGETLGSAARDGIRSGTIGALYALSPAFGFGALGGFLAYRLGGALAQSHDEEMANYLAVHQQSYQLLMEEVCKGNFSVQELLKSTAPQLAFLGDAPKLQTEGFILKSDSRPLPTNCFKLSTDAPTLKATPPIVGGRFNSLPDDPPLLAGWYRSALPN